MQKTTVIRTLFCCLMAAVSGCSEKATEAPRLTGHLVRLDPELDGIIDTNSRAEVLASGFDWSEGPLWLDSLDMLLFSDVPRNTVYSWTERDSISVYLSPSGYTLSLERGGEPGSNGLLLDPTGNLVLCQHGNRQVAHMDASLRKPIAEFTPLADQFDSMKFNSPNDAVFDREGALYFTDPPYGLESGEGDPLKEIPFQGVYRVVDGVAELLTDSLTRPNGLGFLPGENTLVVANSDPELPNWYVMDRLEDGSFSKPRLFLSASGAEGPGLPDGLKINSDGIIFATGPGGIWIIDSKGKLLGKYLLDGPASNCALSADEKTLYITNDDKVLRLDLI